LIEVPAAGIPNAAGCRHEPADTAGKKQRVYALLLDFDYVDVLLHE
jgi:hypothetical protein